MSLLFGSDPELFVTEKKGGKDYAIPVPHFIREFGAPILDIDNAQKHPVLFREDNFSIMMDGVAFEFTLPPTKTAKKMYNNIQEGIATLSNYVSNYGYNVTIKPTVNYDYNRFYSEDDILFYQCGIFGCDPDKDAILGDGYDSPEIDVTNHEYRYGGGHFHISDDNKLIRRYPIPMIKLLAICQGNYSIATSPYPELEKKRAWKYGQPARYRIQNYKGGQIGVEYRTPSNHWISSLETVEGMYHYAERAYNYLKEERIDVIEEYLDATVEAINSADSLLSKQILNSLP